MSMPRTEIGVAAKEDRRILGLQRAQAAVWSSPTEGPVGIALQPERVDPDAGFLETVGDSPETVDGKMADAGLTCERVPGHDSLRGLAEEPRDLPYLCEPYRQSV